MRYGAKKDLKMDTWWFSWKYYKKKWTKQETQSNQFSSFIISYINHSLQSASSNAKRLSSWFKFFIWFSITLQIISEVVICSLLLDVLLSPLLAPSLWFIWWLLLPLSLLAPSSSTELIVVEVAVVVLLKRTCWDNASFSKVLETDELSSSRQSILGEVLLMKSISDICWLWLMLVLPDAVALFDGVVGVVAAILKGWFISSKPGGGGNLANSSRNWR